MLPIWIGGAEASAIHMELAGMKFSRPLTHDLLASVIEEMGGVIDRIEINNLQNHTFYARIHIAYNFLSASFNATPPKRKSRSALLIVCRCACVSCANSSLSASC